MKFLDWSGQILDFNSIEMPYMSKMIPQQLAERLDARLETTSYQIQGVNNFLLTIKLDWHICSLLYVFIETKIFV